jgi:hypothetical protein
MSSCSDIPDVSPFFDNESDEWEEISEVDDYPYQ